MIITDLNNKFMSEYSNYIKLEKYFIDRSIIEYDLERTIKNVQDNCILKENEFLFAIINGINKRNPNKGRFWIVRAKRKS